MEDIPRSSTPVASQAIDPDLLQQVLLALTNLQVQASQRPVQPPRDPRAPDVPMFSGQKNQYSVFLARLQNFFSLQPNSYKTDSLRIGYVISRLDGSAADWAVTILENQGSGNNYEILNNWTSFLQAFSKFSDPFSKRNATDSLLSLSQGKSQSVLSYWTKFSELLYRSDISPDSARPLFERGLKYEIRDRLVDKNLSDNLDEFVMEVVDLDNRLYRLRQDRTSARNNAQSFRNDTIGTSQFGGHQFKSMPQPMEIGNLNTDGLPEKLMVNGMSLANSQERLMEIRRMEPDERRKLCVAEHRCHYCKRVVGNPPIHVALNCPFKVNKSKSDYLDFMPEVPPQKGIPDNILERVPPRQDIYVNIVNDRKDSLFFVQMEILLDGQKLELEAMVDSGAMGIGFMDRNLAKYKGLPVLSLNTPVKVKSVDGTACGNGLITEKALLRVKIQDILEEVEFLIIDCPKTPIILGLEWLRKHNPVVDWGAGTLKFIRDIVVKKEGIPGCSPEGIPQRQVPVNSPKRNCNLPSTAKRVTYSTRTSVRTVENYIKLLQLEELGLTVALPESTDTFVAPETSSTLNDPIDSIYLSVNALLDLAEQDESLMIGIVKGYEVVPTEEPMDSCPEEIFSEFEDVFSQTEFPALPTIAPESICR